MTTPHTPPPTEPCDLCGYPLTYVRDLDRWAARCPACHAVTIRDLTVPDMLQREVDAGREERS